jgi:hypothetical protein
MASDPHLQQQLQGMSLNNPAQHYPAVPQPAPMQNVPPGYPSSYPAAAGGAQYPPAPGVPATAPGFIGGYPGSGYAQHAASAGAGSFAAPSSNGSAPSAPPPGPTAVSSGWTPESVKPEHAVPGQSAGHYGHLQ